LDDCGGDEEQQLHATLHQEVIFTSETGRVSITLDILPDDDNPPALLRATDASGEMLAEARVSPGFKLTRASATAWAEAEFSPQPTQRSK
jgi:hypothetical protein